MCLEDGKVFIFTYDIRNPLKDWTMSKDDNDFTRSFYVTVAACPASIPSSSFTASTHNPSRRKTHNHSSQRLAKDALIASSCIFSCRLNPLLPFASPSPFSFLHIFASLDPRFLRLQIRLYFTPFFFQ
ncbi:hypothetical protein PIB30_015447 [Stylosanthes scabra]|uniref:Uncharacterized protein n=1 Tax=Stylosanthes scabra TaxID=79078 RepID=A0ABU6U616_9FABA|nr:hypothetical protein [Stylosanthes scabra]